MYCKNCGAQIDDDAQFCPHCGVAVNNNYNPNYNNNYNAPYNTHSYAPDGQPKERNAIALIGFIFSIIGFGSLVMGIAGLVCSILGLKQAIKNNTNKGFAIAGIVISIIAIITQILVIISEVTDGTSGTYGNGDFY